MSLVSITVPDFDVDLALAYATAGNFTGAPIYRRAAAYLHPDAAAALRRAIDLARPHGLRFRIFDAFRPAEAQWKIGATHPIRSFSPIRGAACRIRAAPPWT